jgi:hypothetical protein
MPRGGRVAKFALTLVRLVVDDGKRIAFDDSEIATAAMSAGGPASAVIP